MHFSELKFKEVINEKTCKVLGNVGDLTFDEKTGCICALIVPGPAKFCGLFGREMEYEIPFKSVVCIGEDIILICIEEKECLKKISSKGGLKDSFF